MIKQLDYLKEEERSRNIETESDLYKVHLNPSDFDNYTFSRDLGKGAYGTVYLLTSEDKHDYVAIKAFKPDSKHDLKEVNKEFQTELENFKTIGNHDNLVKFRLAFTEFELIDGSNCSDLTTGIHKIALEYCKEGDLTGIFENEIGRFYDESTVRDIIMQSAKGLQHMVDKGFLHRDIKPANILVKSYKPIHVVVADLNFAAVQEDCTGKFGTTLYKAPEMSMRRFRSLKNKSGRRVVDEKADVWSLGIIAYELLAGRQKPFQISSGEFHQILDMSESGREMGERLERARHRNAYDNLLKFEPPEQWINVSKEGKKVVSNMLKYTPEDRLTYEDILDSCWANKEFTSPCSLYDHNEFLVLQEGRGEEVFSCFMTT